MDAATYLKTKARMCSLSMKGDHCTPSTCSLGKFNDCDAFYLAKLGKIDEAVQIVEDWLEKNPAKTRQKIFIEHYPDVPLSGGVITIKPCQMEPDFTYSNCGLGMDHKCIECRIKYWLAEA